MVKKLVKEALALAEQGIYVFPVNAKTKKPVWAAKDSPNGRGGHLAATVDPDEIKALFERGTGIGVFLKASGLIAFDIDFREGADKANAKLLKWRDETLPEAGCRIHLSQNGGEHWIYAYPENDARPPGAIFPELQVKWDGYIVWPTEDSNYEVDQDWPLDKLDQPPVAALIVCEAKVGATQIGGIMSYNDAIQTLRGDEEGQRHEAINALAMYVVRENPDMDLRAAVNEVANLIDEHMPKSDRKDELLRITLEPASEVVRSVKPLMKGGKLREKAVGDSGNDRLAEALANMKKAKPLVNLGATEKVAKSRSQPKQPAIPKDWSLFRRYDKARELELSPWVIENVIRQGDIGAVIGVPGVGKTNVSALWISCLICGDGSKAGLDIPKPINVAWLNPEEDVDALDLRLRATMAEHGMSPSHAVYTAGSDQLLNLSGDFASLVITDGDRPQINQELVDAYVKQLKEAEVELLMLDPITEFNGGNENARDDTRMLFRAMMEISQRCDLTTLYWGHTAKPPEGKREDWYRGDLYAQRGSSGAVGSLKMGATLTPVFPPNTKTAEAKDYRQKAKNGEAPNVVDLTIMKAKMGNQQPHLFYEIAPSEMDAAVPVASLSDRSVVDSYGSSKLAEAFAAEAESWSQKLIDRFGVGEHAVKSSEIGEAMGKKVNDWKRIQDFVDTFSIPSRFVGGYTIQLLNPGRGAQLVIQKDKV